MGGLETPPIKRFNTLCAISGQHFITYTYLHLACNHAQLTKEFWITLAYAQCFQVLVRGDDLGTYWMVERKKKA